MITISSLLEDPVVLEGHKDANGVVLASQLVHVEIAVDQLLKESYNAFREGGLAARTALADFMARTLSRRNLKTQLNSHTLITCETLDVNTNTHTSRRKRKSLSSALNPFVLERTDIWCDGSNVLHLLLRVRIYAHSDASTQDDDLTDLSTVNSLIEQKVLEMLHRDVVCDSQMLLMDAMHHVATVVLQDRLRGLLREQNAVAFCADTAILPRKSGASMAPMASPPAVPFQAPPDSPMNQTLHVDMGELRAYLRSLPPCPLVNGHVPSSSTVSLSGLVVPRGVSLIVGGGYHGKSTMLRTIAAGVYNKVPGDGREFCVTVHDALSIRAEDGRYVNNCNVRAFISNLPAPPGSTQAVDTTHFSTGEASGSTSQAANVVEAMEMGASALLVDEDVSAANFMARDGRMRALVMDESITPLLYRVNGLYDSHGISSIVVVGGVGDWLDVPHSVILMDKYQCRDATAKARSVSRQFSHGHVQYAGRGVVHRLPWDKVGTPFPRRPSTADCELLKSAVVSLLDGTDTIELHGLADTDHTMDVDDEDRYVDMSRCEQLLAKKPQLYGCGLCVLWLLHEARSDPSASIQALLKKLDDRTDNAGFSSICNLLMEENREHFGSTRWKHLIETMGFACRPRRFEIGQALTRLRGITFEEIPVAQDEAEKAAAAEAERKKQELLNLWAARRKNKLNEAS